MTDLAQHSETLRLQQLVPELVSKTGITEASCRIIDEGPQAAAAAVMSNGEQVCFIFNAATTERLSSEGLLALISHEAQHHHLLAGRSTKQNKAQYQQKLAAKKTNYSRFSQASLLALGSAVGSILFFAVLTQQWVIALFAMLLWPIGISLCLITINTLMQKQFGSLHEEEYACDAYGANIASPAAMIEVLENEMQTVKWWHQCTGLVYQHSSLHPSITHRLRRLRQM